MAALTPYVGSLQQTIIVGPIGYLEGVLIDQLEQLETLLLNQVLRDGVLTSTNSFYRVSY